ncbi:hypothetical protein TrVE_jg13985 [Triparma verrucosa]|uniref:RING-type domain-containing protein n=1 Tax=Triparma verrucosa TaxID=1606542 RepID=A0A9W7FH38_9STRA|nr:hypothetical protein TrVE_jg13985 [Triparma verrucosa]
MKFGQTYKEYLSSDLMSWPSTPTPSPWDPSSSTPPPNSCSTFVVNNVHVIGYKMLKKRIKRLDGKRIVNRDNEERDEIVRELENQSKLVERTFIMRYNQICQQKLDSENTQNSGQQSQEKSKEKDEPSSSSRPRSLSSGVGCEKLSAQQLVMFARMNAVALRKIVKKLSKRLAAIERGRGQETTEANNENTSLLPPRPPQNNNNNNSNTNEEEESSGSEEIPPTSPLSDSSVSPTTSPPTISLAPAPPTPDFGSSLILQFRKSYKFAGMERHMQELVAFALLEKLGGGSVTASPPDLKRTMSSPPSPPSSSPQKRQRSNSENLFISKFPELDYTSSSLECSICFEPFFKPVSLHCSHNFCLPCMEKLILNSEPNLSPSEVYAVLKQQKELIIKCPCCRSSTSVGSKMPVLGTLCKAKYPGEFEERRKEVGKEFDEIFVKAWKEANQCNASCVVS